MVGPVFKDHPQHARMLIDAVIAAAEPGRALVRHWVDPQPGPVLIVAIGKASLEMCAAAQGRLADRELLGIVTAVPERIATRTLDPRIAVYPADHPLPTERNVQAARMVAAVVEMFAQTHGASGTLVALISGGGSAHLTLPAGSLTLADLRAVNTALQRAGAPIQDLNAVRKHTEALKGGRLACLAAPARTEAYIVSDVLGDPLDSIASGPLAPDPSTYVMALAVLERFGVTAAAPAVTEHIRQGIAGKHDETPKPGDAVFAPVSSTIIANNEVAVAAAVNELERLGFQVVGTQTGVAGSPADAGRLLATHAAAMATRPGGAAFVMGGETTVQVGSSHGRGGPSQEMALACALELERLASGVPGRGLPGRVAVVTFSTDGVDGPTDAAGATVSTETCRQMRAAGVDPVAALENHDSHTALDRVDALIRTGPTGTNVNHVATVLVYPAPPGAAESQ